MSAERERKRFVNNLSRRLKRLGTVAGGKFTGTVLTNDDEADDNDDYIHDIYISGNTRYSITVTRYYNIIFC